MSWLDDLTPDAGDPTTGMIMGLLGGLGKAASPQFTSNGMGISGQSKGNALLQLFGDLSGGVQGGMQGAQQYKAADMANQSNAIDLANKQAMNPLMMQARMGALQGMNTNPTGLPNVGGMPGSLGGNAPQLSPYQQNAANMIQSAQRHFALTGDDKPLTDAWKSAFENDPSLGAEKEKQKALNSVQTTPNGPMAGYQIPGMTDAPGGLSSPGLFGSLAPAITSKLIGNIVSDRTPGVMGPGNQQPAEMPQAQPINMSMLSQPPQGGAPPPPSPMSLQGSAPGGGAPIPPVQPVQGPQQLPAVPNQAQTGSVSSLPAADPLANPQGIQALISQQQQAVKQPSAQALTASDGKPLVPQIANAPFYKSDPTGTPRYKTDNTNTGVEQTKDFQKADIDADANMSSSLNNTNQMLGRLNDIAEAYKTSQPGTLIAQYPDIANKLIASGAITDKGTIKDVAQFQRVSSDLITETMNQIKTANAGSSQSRILSSEFQGLVQKMADPHLQPEAIQDILAVSKGLGDYNSDQVQGWNKIGGLGNRIANGYTLRPTDYERQFNSTHNLTDYINNARAQTGPMKGQTSDPPQAKNWVRVNGKLVQQ